MALEQLYQEVILDHYKNPRGKRVVPGAELSCSQNNPLCGDEITIYAHLEDGAVADLGFEGSGCSISIASASMLVEAARGRPLNEARDVAVRFRAMMAGSMEPDEDTFGDLVSLTGVRKYPARIKCAVLAWDVFQEALSGAGDTTGEVPH